MSLSNVIRHLFQRSCYRPRATYPTSWSAARLERRVLLSADAGSIAMAACSPSLVEGPTEVTSDRDICVATTATLNECQASSGQEVVFVDARVPKLDDFLAGLRQGVDVVLMDTSRSGIAQMTEALAHRREVRAIHIVGHGASGVVKLGSDELTDVALRDAPARVQSWRRALTDDGDIMIYGCHSGAGEGGARLMKRLALLTGADVAASTNATGSRSANGDWVLERTVGAINTSIAMTSAAQLTYDATLPITVYAAGQMGDEQLSLQIDGVTVQTWTNVGGNVDARVFQAFTYTGQSNVSADRVRVSLLNDAYDPAAGIDRNLAVDRIEIDGIGYETEWLNVLSTGTWKPADGVVTGFRASETLHVNGYFQFASQPAAGGTSISIRAAGQTGQEAMELQIDGVTVSRWTNISTTVQDYSFTASQNVTADRVRVAFTNDLYSPGTGIDRNLRVDRVTVGGVAMETESPLVFSNGTWLPADGVVPGYRQSETLHTNGYFEYAQPTVNNGSRILLRAAGQEGDEQMELQIDGITVQRWRGLGTNVRDYLYVASTTVNPASVRVVFTNDFYDPSNNLDRNLLLDRITIDGTNYETESPLVFSTGTWLPADGATPGFRTSEVLHVNGYFQFASPVLSAGRGLIAEYFDNIDLTNRVLVRTDPTVNFNFGTGSPAPSIGADTFSVRWTGFVEPRYTETYTFQTVSDDGVRLFINDQPVIDQWNDHSTTTHTASVALQAGQRYKLRMEYYDNTGSAVAQLLWSSPRQAQEIIPASQLYEPFGIISLASSVLSVNESTSTVNVTVSRQLGSGGPITVDYRTVDGTAVAGLDYTSRAGTLTFADGETQKVISIPITNDALQEGNEAFSFTIDNVQGGATLLVPRTATVTILDDEILLPSFASFAGATNVRLNGNASIQGDALRLTPAVPSQAGSAYFTTPLTVDANTSFQTRFQAQLAGGTNGGDGLVFMLQNSPSGLGALGGAGGSLGFQGITNSLAIEFDTFQGASDPNGNHVSVLLNGNVVVTADTRTAPFDLNNGNVFTSWVDYNGITNQLAVYVATTTAKPSQPLISVPIDLSAIVGSRAYLGFSAATGSLTNSHDIFTWQFDTTVPTIIPPPTTGNALVSETVASGLIQPTAIDWSDNGRNLLIAEQRGVVRLVRDGTLQSTPFIDISAQVNGVRDRGLLDIAVHPDFYNQPYVYLLFTYDPPEVFNNTGLAGPDGIGNRAGRLIRVTADAATNYTTAVAGSEVVLLGTNSVWANFNGFVNSTTNFSERPAGILPDGTNIRDFIASDSESHTVAGLAFGPGNALYVSIGDGASYNQVDPRAVRVQDINNLSGKILRIDPLTGRGLADNPFYNGDPDANRSKVYMYGLRNPFRITVNQQTGQVYVGDVGWSAWEEINTGGAGSNFGWPYFEGGNGVSLRTTGYQNLAAAQAFYASGQVVVPAAFALSHSGDGINAIVMGDVYTGSAYPSSFRGDLFLNDLGQGIVRNISFDAQNRISSVETFALNANVVVQITQGPDGKLYFADLDDGRVGRWSFV